MLPAAKTEQDFETIWSIYANLTKQLHDGRISPDVFMVVRTDMILRCGLNAKKVEFVRRLRDEGLISDN